MRVMGNCLFHSFCTQHVKIPPAKKGVDKEGEGWTISNSSWAASVKGGGVEFSSRSGLECKAMLGLSFISILDFKEGSLEISAAPNFRTGHGDSMSFKSWLISWLQPNKYIYITYK